jgi:hypothetical protein
MVFLPFKLLVRRVGSLCVPCPVVCWESDVKSCLSAIAALLLTSLVPTAAQATAIIGIDGSARTDSSAVRDVTNSYISPTAVAPDIGEAMALAMVALDNRFRPSPAAIEAGSDGLGASLAIHGQAGAIRNEAISWLHDQRLGPAFQSPPAMPAQTGWS